MKRKLSIKTKTRKRYNRDDQDDYKTPLETQMELRSRYTTYSERDSKFPERKLDLLLSNIALAGEDSNIDIFMIDTFCKKYIQLAQIIQTPTYFVSKILGVLLSNAIQGRVTPQISHIAGLFEKTTTASPYIVIPLVTARILLTLTTQYLVDTSLKRVIASSTTTATMTLTEINKKREQQCQMLYELLFLQENSVLTSGNSKKAYLDLALKKYKVDLRYILDVDSFGEKTKKQLGLVFNKVPFTANSFALVYDRFYNQTLDEKQQDSISQFFAKLLETVDQYKEAVVSLFLIITCDPGAEIKSCIAKLLKYHNPKQDLVPIWKAVNLFSNDLIDAFCLDNKECKFTQS